MTILKTSLLAAAVAVFALSTANAQTRKAVYNGQEYSTIYNEVPTSRAAQELLNW